MRLNRLEIDALTWLATTACLVVAFVGFATVAPWSTSVMSVTEAAVQCPGSIDPSWPAVVCSHSHPYVWKLGLFADNPLRYVLAVLQLTVGLVGFFVGVMRLNKSRHDGGSEPPARRDA